MRGARILVLVKRSSYRLYVEEEPDPLIASLIARHDPTVSRLKKSHEDHEETKREVRAALTALGTEAQFVDGPRSRVDGVFDLVVTIGGDGTLLAASHQLGPETPILGVNSAPRHSVGFFCGTRKGSVRKALDSALRGTMKRATLSRMKVVLNDVCLHKRVLNDVLFCHSVPAATSRYILSIRSREGGPAREEEQRSSGIWVGPAAGSTAAQRSAGGHVLPLTSRRIQYVVREPYTPRGRALGLAVGTVDQSGSIHLRSKMRDAKIYLDGHHIVHDVTMGDVLVMTRSDETLTVLGLGPARAK